jgi:hypothetical protein
MYVCVNKNYITLVSPILPVLYTPGNINQLMFFCFLMLSAEIQPSSFNKSPCGGSHLVDTTSISMANSLAYQGKQGITSMRFAVLTYTFHFLLTKFHVEVHI